MERDERVGHRLRRQQPGGRRRPQRFADGLDGEVLPGPDSALRVLAAPADLPACRAPARANTISLT
jgi:hypothetical protein